MTWLMEEIIRAQGVPPRIVSKERAQYILSTASGFGELRYAYNKYGREGFTPHLDGITREENAFIVNVWSLTGPGRSFYDAVKAIAEG